MERSTKTSGKTFGKDELLRRVRDLVKEATAVRFAGGAYANMAKAHAYADGYMRALIDAGLVDDRELLRVVGSARAEAVDGSDKAGVLGAA